MWNRCLTVFCHLHGQDLGFQMIWVGLKLQSIIELVTSSMPNRSSQYVYIGLLWLGINLKHEKIVFIYATWFMAFL